MVASHSELVMMDVNQTEDLKLDAARRQLGTALNLFLKDADPVSVHCLASGGAEVAEGLANAAGHRTIRAVTIEQRGDIDDRAYSEEKRKYWNAFKHAASRSQKLRDDQGLLGAFTDEYNDALMFVGWYDFMVAGGKMPVEATIFQYWYFALTPEKFSDEPLSLEIKALVTLMFPHLPTAKRSAQKRMLVRAIASEKAKFSVRSNASIDHRPLVLGARP